MKKITPILLTLVAMHYSASSFAMEISPRVLVAGLKGKTGLIPSSGILQITTPIDTLATEVANELTHALDEQARHQFLVDGWEHARNWKRSTLRHITPNELVTTGNHSVILSGGNTFPIPLMMLSACVKRNRQWVVIANEPFLRSITAVEYFG